MTVQKWNVGEPSGNGLCVALVNKTVWQDRPCTDAYFAICERP